MASYFCQYFQILSIFIYSESLPMKSFQFFEFTNALIRKEKKHLYRSQWVKKTEWKTDCFIKPFKMRINHFFLFSKLNCGTIFDFWNHDDARNIKSGNWEQQIAKNGKLQHLYQKQFQSRRMLKSRVPLENISRVLLNLIKRWIFVTFKNASPPNVHIPQLTVMFSL